MLHSKLRFKPKTSFAIFSSDWMHIDMKMQNLATTRLSKPLGVESWKLRSSNSFKLLRTPLKQQLSTLSNRVRARDWRQSRPAAASAAAWAPAPSQTHCRTTGAPRDATGLGRIRSATRSLLARTAAKVSRRNDSNASTCTGMKVDAATVVNLGPLVARTIPRSDRWTAPASTARQVCRTRRAVTRRADPPVSTTGQRIRLVHPRPRFLLITTHQCLVSRPRARF